MRRTRREADARRGGQILVITIVGITLLAGIVLYVYNTGDQVNLRLEMQNAADSTAISGSTWMSRSMNVVAMNNVAIARLIAAAIVLDSMPLAAEMSIAEESGLKDLSKALEKWSTVGAQFTPYERENFFRVGLAELYRQLTEGTLGGGSQHYDKRQLELLKLLDNTFDSDDERQPEGGYVITNDTHHGGGPSGRIWQACEALDLFSQSIADSAGLLSQYNAIRFGKDNRATAAFLVPVMPEFPGVRTHFYDYKALFLKHLRIINDWRTGQEDHRIIDSRLVEKLQASTDVPWDSRIIGVRGGAIPDWVYPYRLGPFARVYYWRDYNHASENNWWDEDYRTFRIGYTTYGPLENAIRTVTNQFGRAGSHSGSVDTSRFSFHLRTIAKIKLAYLFGLSSPQNVQYAKDWITDYNEAKAYVEEHKNEPHRGVMTTRYYRVGAKSTAHYDSGDWMKTYDPTPPTETFTPLRWHSHQLKSPPPEDDWRDLGNARIQPLYRWIADSRGWHDVGGWTKLTDYVWYRKSIRQVNHDYELRLPPRYEKEDDGSFKYERDDDGNIILDKNGEPEKIPIPYTIYSVSWQVFGGIELRDEQPVSNLIAGVGSNALPAPFLISSDVEEVSDVYYDDPDSGRPMEGVRVKPFTYLGVVMKGNTAPVWPARFDTKNPLDAMLTVAQSKMFNNRSWGLWTQDWQTQLMPVVEWNDWVRKLGDGVGEASLTEGELDADDVSKAHEYMSAIPESMAERYGGH